MWEIKSNNVFMNDYLQFKWDLVHWHISMWEPVSNIQMSKAVNLYPRFQHFLKIYSKFKFVLKPFCCYYILQNPELKRRVLQVAFLKSQVQVPVLLISNQATLCPQVRVKHHLECQGTLFSLFLISATQWPVKSELHKSDKTKRSKI